MTPTLSPLLNRLCAVAILLAIIGATAYGIAIPLLESYQDSAVRIEQLRAALTRYERAGRGLEQRQAELAVLKQRQATAEGFLPGASEALAAAAVQNRIKTLAEASKGELKSTQILPPQDEGKFRRIAVRAQMTLKLPAAQRVLYGLESGAPLLFLDNLNIRAHGERRREDTPDDPILELRFDVYGYTRGAK
ncbi:MAG TPA: type II secretion system protein GspM [Stellaceae bacterium]|jgi:general secretion pathway protein M|nr:type II secretion system protein GspM [Stellaceae bacterium]